MSQTRHRRTKLRARCRGRGLMGVYGTISSITQSTLSNFTWNLPTLQNDLRTSAGKRTPRGTNGKCEVQAVYRGNSTILKVLVERTFQKLVGMADCTNSTKHHDVTLCLSEHLPASNYSSMSASLPESSSSSESSRPRSAKASSSSDSSSSSSKYNLAS